MRRRSVVGALWLAVVRLLIAAVVVFVSCAHSTAVSIRLDRRLVVFVSCAGSTAVRCSGLLRVVGRRGVGRDVHGLGDLNR